MNNLKNFIKSKKFIIVIAGFFSLALLTGIFGLGVAVGYQKANFSYAWGENYHRNFGGPKGGFVHDFSRNFGDKDFINGHGIFGQIIKIDDNMIIVKGKDGVEKPVIISDKTTVNKWRESIKISDLKVDDQIIIIGDPNEQGQIEAKFIRIFK